MITKDWLKLVFAGKKRLLEMNEVSRVNVPAYDELSVTNLWKEVSLDTDFMQFMPDSFPKGKNCDRRYFFNILNTVHPEYCKNIVQHASEQRMSSSGQKMQDNNIEVNEEWHAKLMAVPFISCKYLFRLNIVQNLKVGHCICSRPRPSLYLRLRRGERSR
tara:strand:- start:1227 stop:1706 length:480 start_codon:yes stop_codon:yes gene_type:complete